MSRFRFARLVGLALAATPLSLLACEGRLHIEVQQTGVYSLDRDAIVAQQPGLSDCPADQLVLTGQGKEVPIRIVGDTKGYAIAIDASTFDGAVFSNGGKLINDDFTAWQFNGPEGQAYLTMLQPHVKQRLEAFASR